MPGQVSGEQPLVVPEVAHLAKVFQAPASVVLDTKGRTAVLLNSQGQILKVEFDQRELDFYQNLSNSSDPECQQWKELAPKFFGTEIFHGENGESTQCLVLGKC